MKEKLLERLRERSGERDLFKDLRFGVRPLPGAELVEVLPEKGEPLPKDTDLTIAEIRERRRAKWREEKGTL